MPLVFKAQCGYLKETIEDESSRIAIGNVSGVANQIKKRGGPLPPPTMVKFRKHSLPSPQMVCPPLVGVGVVVHVVGE